MPKRFFKSNCGFKANPILSNFNKFYFDITFKLVYDNYIRAHRRKKIIEW